MLHILILLVGFAIQNQITSNLKAGQRGAVLYTIVESCRRRGIDPFAYLRDVLTPPPIMLITEVADITPEAWAKAQRQPIDLKVAS